MNEISWKNMFYTTYLLQDNSSWAAKDIAHWRDNSSWAANVLMLLKDHHIASSVVGTFGLDLGLLDIPNS